MASSYGDRLAKLGAKLDTIDTQITELKARRENIVNEISAMTTSSTAAMRATATQHKQQNISEMIAPILPQFENGANTADLAAKLRMKPAKIGLSLYHMERRGEVRQENGRYFLNNTGTDN